ncbi:MAG: polymer-forming cytoskeletal protein [Ketobacteraceae bacterium]|nr:polymer-forming cytoskeletal protein [Ketobacteraceae bacterium]
MWGKDKAKKVDLDRHAGKTTMIAQGTALKGDINFEGGLLVEGVIKGNVTAEPGSDALLRLSEVGRIDGEINVPNVVINGKVTGNVFSSGHVELAAKAVVNGDVHYNLIEMVMGSEVNGSLLHDQHKEVTSPKSDAKSVVTLGEKAKGKSKDAPGVSNSTEKKEESA